MKRSRWPWLVLSLLLLANAPAQGAPANSYLDLDFEAPDCAGGWYSGSRGYEVQPDTQVFQSGRSSLRMRYTAKDPWIQGGGRFGVVSRPFPAEAVAGRKVRFSGAIRTEGVSKGYAGLWWRADGEGTASVFDNMAGRGASGTTPWTRYQIDIEVPKEAKQVIFGALFPGDGTAWFDDLRVEIDGVRWVEGPPIPNEKPGEAAVAWLRKHAIPFSTPEAGHGFADLQPLKKLIGNARIVSLGEGTHGTREFFQMKHRLTEFLASEMGFTLFAIEANMPEAYRVNDYVLTGKGDPKELLKGMYFWTWNTQEVLDMILWMRAFNQSGKGRIQFLGFDMQGATVSAQIVRDFATKAEPDWAASLAGAFAEVDKTREASRDVAGSASEEAVKAAEEARKRSLQAAKDTLAHLEAGRQGYLARFPKEEVEWAIQNARIVLQAAQLGEDSRVSRDHSMARNVEWILDQAPGAKIVLWAHNAHVSREEGAMGGYLAERFGKDMVVLGFSFGQGTYTAVGDQGLGTQEALPVMPGSVESYLHSAGLPRLILDLRGAAGSPAAPWLAAERPFRSIGARAVRCAFYPTPVASHYDGLVWLAETRHSVTLP